MHLIEVINQEIEKRESQQDKLEKIIEDFKICDKVCRIPDMNIPEHEMKDCCDDCDVLKAITKAWNLGFRTGKLQ